MELTVMQLGATVNSLKFEGRETMLRYESEAEYLDSNTYFSSVIGRYGNRIGGAEFPLDGKTYKLDANEGKNQLHGGRDSINRRMWTVEQADTEQVKMSIIMPDGDNGFPGNLKMTVTFKLSDNSLLMVFEGETDAPSVFAPTFHPFFVYNEAKLKINASEHVEVDNELIPTGRLLPCNDEFDYSAAREVPLTLDDAFVLNGEYALSFENENYSMELWTDFPAVQIYSANPNGVAIEPEFFPDSPNHPNFPSTMLRPGEKFRRYAEYRFFKR